MHTTATAQPHHHHTRHHSFPGLSILSLRRDTAASCAMGPPPASSSANHGPVSAQELELESFQKQVTEGFQHLLSSSEDLLSISWIQKLLDCFLPCQEHFHEIILKNRWQLPKAPADRLFAEFSDRMIKALDVLNAVGDGVDQIRDWEKLTEIVVCALDGKKYMCEGQFRRAKKALLDVAIGMIDEKDSGSVGSHSQRNRSFGRNNNSTVMSRYFRSLSWSVSRGWSAAKQIQAIGNNLNYPKGNEMMATSGLALAIYTMGVVLLFVMWALVAAIPCQDRGLQVHLAVPRHLGWAGPVMTLHSLIVEESKKRRSTGCGLLREIHVMEERARSLREAIDSIHKFPVSAGKESEVKHWATELRNVSETLKEGLDPLERKVRQVFHQIVKSRSEESWL